MVSIKHLSAISILISYPALSANNIKLKELFTPVTKEVYNELLEKNELFMKNNLYFSKKHAVVKTSPNLLLNNEEYFSIELIKGLKLKVRSDKTVNSYIPKSYTWKGIIEPPKNKVFYQDGRLDDKLTKRMNEIQLFIREHQIPFTPDDNSFTSSTSNGKEITVHSVSGEFNHINGKKYFFIKNFPNTPQYSLVYLADKAKFGGRGYPDAEERAYKYSEFKKQLEVEMQQ